MTEEIASPASASSDSESGRLAAQDALNAQDAKTPEVVVVAESLDGSAGGPAPDHEPNRNPFADPEVAAYYATLYEKSQYECRHVFDPTLEWTPAEERKLVRKLDWHVCLWAVSLLSL